MVLPGRGWGGEVTDKKQPGDRRPDLLGLPGIGSGRMGMVSGTRNARDKAMIPRPPSNVTRVSRLATSSDRCMAAADRVAVTFNFLRRHDGNRRRTRLALNDGETANS